MERSQFPSKLSKNLNFGQKFRKFSIWVKIDSKLSMISILAKIFENLDCGVNSRKISILPTIFENFNFGIFFLNLDFGVNFRKISIFVNFSIVSILVEEKFRFE